MMPNYAPYMQWCAVFMFLARCLEAAFHSIPSLVFDIIIFFLHKYGNKGAPLMIYPQRDFNIT